MHLGRLGVCSKGLLQYKANFTTICKISLQQISLFYNLILESLCSNRLSYWRSLVSFSGKFTHSEGGVLQTENSDVVLKVPPGAVPQGKVYNIKGQSLLSSDVEV